MAQVMLFFALVVVAVIVDRLLGRRHPSARASTVPDEAVSRNRIADEENIPYALDLLDESDF